MVMQQGAMTPQDLNNALTQVEAQEGQIEQQQRQVQRELKKLETQQLILDQNMHQNEAAEQQLETLQARVGGGMGGAGVMGRAGMMHQNMPQQMGGGMGVGMQGRGAMARGRPKRSYLMAGVVAVAGLYLLGKQSDSIRPIMVKATQEGMSFKDWIVRHAAGTKKKFKGVTLEAEKVSKKSKSKKTTLASKERELMSDLDKYLEKLEKELEEKGSSK